MLIHRTLRGKPLLKSLMNFLLESADWTPIYTIRSRRSNIKDSGQAISLARGKYLKAHRYNNFRKLFTWNSTVIARAYALSNLTTGENGLLRRFNPRNVMHMSSHDLQHPFLFAVDAPAIFLSIKPKCPVSSDALVPTCSPIPIKERNLRFLGNGFTCRFQEIVFLKTTIKQCRGERVKTFGFRQSRRHLHPKIETHPASL